jgi:hypothetical protein
MTFADKDRLIWLLNTRTDTDAILILPIVTPTATQDDLALLARDNDCVEGEDDVFRYECQKFTRDKSINMLGSEFADALPKETTFVIMRFFRKVNGAWVAEPEGFIPENEDKLKVVVALIPKVESSFMSPDILNVCGEVS